VHCIKLGERLRRVGGLEGCIHVPANHRDLKRHFGRSTVYALGRAVVCAGQLVGTQHQAASGTECLSHRADAMQLYFKSTGYCGPLVDARELLSFENEQPYVVRDSSCLISLPAGCSCAAKFLVYHSLSAVVEDVTI
jgi:hypothetical protein